MVVASTPSEGKTETMMAASSSSSTSSIITMHHDIIHTHILTRLDAATLATTASTCSHLRHLCIDDNLWRKICTATWPSLADPTTCHIISTFPNRHRSLFSDAFPVLHHFSCNSKPLSSPPPIEIISAVDVFYKGKPVFSRVRRTETTKNSFLSSPLWIEILEPNELVPTEVKFVRKDDELLKHLEENLSLSWILLDPTGKRSANVSSRKPVLVRRHWLTRDVEILFAVTMAGEARRATETVQCTVKVTCCGKVGGELHVREVSLVMEDMDGGKVSGKEGVMILQKAMEFGERKKVGEVGEMMERFDRFLSVVRERRERKYRRQKERDGVSMVVAFVVCVWFCYLAGF
ncbi:F-box protein At2g27310-like [Vicia villosa]|uniref:F-box protein At2g27310-like n=1 Tax=Vicia villosa TaxID=3911 RepID=UPI00273BA868|nr:F-box protein At2g27310-like [Vicia villosa]